MSIKFVEVKMPQWRIEYTMGNGDTYIKKVAIESGPKEAIGAAGLKLGDVVFGSPVYRIQITVDQ